MKRRRPWKVFVFDIGPTWSFANEEEAHARARLVTGQNSIVIGKYLHGPYSQVSVYGPFEPGQARRTLYEEGHAPREQVFSFRAQDPVGWFDVAE